MKTLEELKQEMEAARAAYEAAWDAARYNAAALVAYKKKLKEEKS